MDIPDTPTLALYHISSPPPSPHHHHHHRRASTRSPHHFIRRSVYNLKQGNVALFIMFCGCLIIFLRALCGAGYDEALSAHADARIAKHPSLLARWGPQSQRLLEKQWKMLRSSGGSGLWGKIKRDDARAAEAARLPPIDQQTPKFHIQPLDDHNPSPSIPEHEDLDLHDNPAHSATPTAETAANLTSDEYEEDG